MPALQFQGTQAEGLETMMFSESAFQRVFAANDKPDRTVTRIYADGHRTTGAARPDELPVRIKSEVKNGRF